LTIRCRGYLAFGLLLGLFSAQALHAQAIGTLPDGVSTQVSESDQQQGFDTSFESSDSNLSDPELRTDISDPTHSVLENSTSSALVNGYADSYAETQPRTQVLTDAQQAVSFGDSSFGGSQSRAFTTQAFGGTGLSRRLSGASPSIGSGASAFPTSISARAAFSSQTAQPLRTNDAFAGRGITADAAPADPSYSGAYSVAPVSLPDGTRAVLQSDPAFTNVSTNLTGPIDTTDDLPQPTVAAAAFFARQATTPPQTQFDDGQTPLLAPALEPGRVIGQQLEYANSSTGFSDSTRGLAGLPLEAAQAYSPLERSPTMVESPFPAVSSGEVFGQRLYLLPDLHTQESSEPQVNLTALRVKLRQAEQKRIFLGMSPGRAEQIYRLEFKQALQKARQPRTDLPELSDQGEQSRSAQPMQDNVIR
jgi:hypothetical protein